MKKTLEELIREGIIGGILREISEEYEQKLEGIAEFLRRIAKFIGLPGRILEGTFTEISEEIHRKFSEKIVGGASKRVLKGKA